MCIFCQIASHEVPTEFLFEDDEIMAFYDIKPSAAVHILVLPKKHIVSLTETNSLDVDLLGKLLYRAKLLAVQHGLVERGYKVVVNNGEWGGQIIPHLHLHLLGGENLQGKISV